MADDARLDADAPRAPRQRARVRTLTKSKLIDGIVEQTGLPRADATELVESLLETMKDTLGQGENLKISGFGSFVVRTKSARRGRNPQTGGTITLPRRRVLTFKPSPILRDLLLPLVKRG